MDHYLQAIVTLLTLINPIVCATIFMQAQEGQTKSAQFKATLQTAVAVLVILLLAALFGTKLLHSSGISLDAFSVAGGGVLAWIGFSMINKKADDSPEVKQSTTAQPTIIPLILFAASPGTITAVITLAVAHSRLDLPVTALVAIGVGVLVMWLLMLAAILLGDSKKTPNANIGLARDISSRLMGLIVLAMGIQFALNGLRAFFSHTTAL